MVAYAHYPQDPRIKREAQSMVRAGISVSIICLRDQGERARQMIEGVNVTRVPLTVRRGGRTRYLFQYLVFMLMVLANIRRVRASVPTTHVHVHSVPDFLVFVALPARVTGLRVILDLHEAMPELVAARFRTSPTSSIVALARAMELLSCMLAHDVITVNERIRSLLVQRGIPAKKLTVIFNSPAIEFALPTGPGNRIVYAGGLNRERDIEVVIRAFSLVRAELGVPLFIYGRGEADYVARLERLIVDLGLRGRVEVREQVPYQLAIEEMARSIVGIVPYEHNPITEVAVPNKLFEFALARRPLVVADLPAIREVVGDAALYYSPGNPKDLAEKIRLSSRGGPEVQARVERAARIAAKLGWRVMENRLLKLYDEGGRPPEEYLSAEGEVIA